MLTAGDSRSRVFHHRRDWLAVPEVSVPHQRRPCVHVVDHVGSMHFMQAHGLLQRRYRSLTTPNGVYDGDRRVIGVLRIAG